MRNTLSSIVLVLMLGGCQTTSLQQHRQELLVTRHASFVETPISTGSAWPITDSVFLTAWHVVEGWHPEQIKVDGQDASKIVRLGEIDAALVYMVSKHGLAPWPFEGRAPEPGETVYKSGFGQGLHWWTEGLGTEDPERVALDIFPGDSGCPLFDAQGDVIGIIVAVGAYRSSAITHHAWIVPMSWIVPELPGDLFGPPQVVLSPIDRAWQDYLREKRRLGL